MPLVKNANVTQISITIQVQPGHSASNFVPHFGHSDAIYISPILTHNMLEVLHSIYPQILELYQFFFLRKGKSWILDLFLITLYPSIFQVRNFPNHIFIGEITVSFLAEQALRRFGQMREVEWWLKRHQCGNWGLVDMEQKKANDYILKYRDMDKLQKVTSAYETELLELIWVITYFSNSIIYTQIIRSREFDISQNK